MRIHDAHTKYYPILGKRDCGDFNSCNKGSTFFYCTEMKEHTAHGVLPVPFAGQTIELQRLATVRKWNKTTNQFEYIDNPKINNNNNNKSTSTAVPVGWTGTKLSMTKISGTSVYKPFAMPPFYGAVEVYNLGGNGSRGRGSGNANTNNPTAYVLRNYDGRNGQLLATALEHAYGIDVLSGKGTNAKCAAAMGGNCQDKYDKLYPARMFLDERNAGMMQPILTECLATVNIHLQKNTSNNNSGGGDTVSAGAAATAVSQLSLQHGSKQGECVVGESQVLRFKSNTVTRGTSKKKMWSSSSSSSSSSCNSISSRMHLHLDMPGTRWVAIASLGDTGNFFLDNASVCDRCYLPSNLTKDRGKRIRPNLSRAGFGTNTPNYKEWHTVQCKSCTPISLESGDCLLFFGHPTALVAHGSIGTQPNTSPGHLPTWAKGCRVSVQYRQTDKVEFHNSVRSNWD